MNDPYNTTPERFASGRERRVAELSRHGRGAERFPNRLVTMLTWITKDRAERHRVLGGVLMCVLKRNPEQLRGQVCIGSAEWCTELLSRYARAGCHRVYLWPLGDERRQLELVAAQVAPRSDRGPG
jgi:hypothetical protein